MRFFCLGDEETVRGFRLAGVDGQVVTSPEAAEIAVAALIEREDCGVILVTESVVLTIPETIQRLRLSPQPPLLVEVPGPAGSLPQHRGLVERVERAAGLRVDEAELLR